MYEGAKHRMWRALATAACGRIVHVVCLDERDTAMAFNRYVDALENAGLDKSRWSVRKANGNRAIRFENGGEVRFISHYSQCTRGTRAGAVVIDA